MQILNVMLIASANSKALPMILSSKYLGKLYSNFEAENCIEIQFNTFRELSEKCKSLKVDIVIVEDEKFIKQGIADVLRKNFVNVVSINSFWSNLVLSKEFARKICEKYYINIPSIYYYPKEFPVIIKSDISTKTAYSMEDIIGYRDLQKNSSPEILKTIYLEEFIDGEKVDFVSLFDGKNLIGYSDKYEIMEYLEKLAKMIKEENPNFMGFITSKLIVKSDTVYNVGFEIGFPTLSSDIDILYLLISAIYQKLDEIELKSSL